MQRWNLAKLYCNYNFLCLMNIEFFFNDYKISTFYSQEYLFYVILFFNSRRYSCGNQLNLNTCRGYKGYWQRYEQISRFLMKSSHINLSTLNQLYKLKTGTGTGWYIQQQAIFNFVSLWRQLHSFSIKTNHPRITLLRSQTGIKCFALLLLLLSCWQVLLRICVAKSPCPEFYK